MRANYHTHTPRCNHAQGREEAYILRALEAGFEELGFSDHSPYFFDRPGYYSSFRMRPEQLEDYVSTLLELREQYRDRIRLHIGRETEYYPKTFPKLLDFFKEFPLDYLLLGQHALCNETEGIYSTQPTDDPKRLDRYLGQTLEALDTGCFSCFAHPDILFFTGDRKRYEAHVRALCRGAMDRGIPLEFNLLGFREGKHYPNLIFWQIAGEEGCPAVLGSDAHEPAATWDPFLVQKAETFLGARQVRILDRLFLRKPN